MLCLLRLWLLRRPPWSPLGLCSYFNTLSDACQVPLQIGLLWHAEMRSQIPVPWNVPSAILWTRQMPEESLWTADRYRRRWTRWTRWTDPPYCTGHGGQAAISWTGREPPSDGRASTVSTVSLSKKIRIWRYRRLVENAGKKRYRRTVDIGTRWTFLIRDKVFDSSQRPRLRLLGWASAATSRPPFPALGELLPKIGQCLCQPFCVVFLVVFEPILRALFCQWANTYQKHLS
ncbi:hypothetical protein phiVC8_p47 [Vibrio phage phiVC8]|uniref:Uncharacterized protein n=1 Tax=Vibrio phage phiVC8 TaxID=1076759 RepID=G3FFQ6_BPVC8|nr:hypothetical protein phiVC8_p47 [Vibrio phage phiVC8]AEM62944.1 hypothetical protein phiVC8_p47 [Vibrio phage phiVC8]